MNRIVKSFILAIYDPFIPILISRSKTLLFVIFLLFCGIVYFTSLIYSVIYDAIILIFYVTWEGAQLRGIIKIIEDGKN